MQGLETIGRMNRAAADAHARRATTPPRKYESFYVKSDGSQMTVDERAEWGLTMIPLLVVTLVRGGEDEAQRFLAYQRAGEGAFAYAGGRDDILAVLRDIGVVDGDKLLTESFGVSGKAAK